MGKHSKKMKKQAQKNNDAKKMQQCQSLETGFADAFSAEEYAKALEILAELIQAGDIKPDLLYKGAYSYFMLGDYERAAQWVSNTLNYAPQHVEARILLARLCFIQDRHEDGLAIYEFLVQNYRQTMTEDQQEQIKDSSAYYVRREAEKVRQNYPQLAELLQLNKPSVEESAPSAATASVPAEGSALSALQRLKAKLQAVQERKDQEEAMEQPAEQTVEQPVEQYKPVPAEKPAAEVESHAVEQIAEIQNRVCSYREKVQLLNRFAGAQYMEKDYPGAEAYLKAALQLDDRDEQSIRNMAMVKAALGEQDKAQALAAQLTEVDFVFLYLLREQAHG